MKCYSLFKKFCQIAKLNFIDQNPRSHRRQYFQIELEVPRRENLFPNHQEGPKNPIQTVDSRDPLSHRRQYFQIELEVPRRENLFPNHQEGPKNPIQTVDS